MNKKRISTAMAFLIVGVAVILDGTKFFLLLIPIIGEILDWFIGVFADLLFFAWFLLLRVNYFGGKKAGAKLLTMLGMTVVELIPVLDVLPAVSAGVITLIFLTWSEDRGTNKQTVQQAAVLAQYANAEYQQRREQILEANERAQQATQQRQLEAQMAAEPA